MTVLSDYYGSAQSTRGDLCTEYHRLFYRDHNLDAVEHQGPFLTFPKTVKTLLATKGFLAPLAAFVCSIGVTNVISGLFQAHDCMRS